MSQGSTLEALRGQHSVGEIIFPVGVVAIGRQWIEKAATGFWLLVSDGRLKLALHVVEIIGKGRVAHTKGDGPGCKRRSVARSRAIGILVAMRRTAEMISTCR